MVVLCDLANELLLNIAFCLTEQKDRCAFQLTCRKLAPIGQEALYTTPILPDTHPLTESHVIMFARTLLERPELGKMVRELDLPIFARQLESGKAGVGHCHTVHDKTTCEAALSYIGALGDLPMSDQWKKAVRQRWEPAFAGIILFAVPNLRSLDISMFSFKENLTLRTIVDASVLFGKRVPQDSPDFSTTIHLSLPNLQVLGSPSMVSWHFLNIPSLRAVGLGTLSSTGWLGNNNTNIIDILGPHWQAQVDPVWTAFSSITSLTFGANHRILCAIGGRNDDLSYEVLRRFVSLRHVHVLLAQQGRGDYPEGEEDRSYQHLLERLDASRTTLETLVVDIDDDYYSMYEAEMFQYQEVPMYSVQHFTSLKRLVAIEGVYRSWYWVITKQPSAIYPETIEVLEVICPCPDAGFEGWIQGMIKAKKGGFLSNLRDLVIHTLPNDEPLYDTEVLALKRLGVAVELIYEQYTWRE